jgi:hypothetical protein
MANVAMTEKDSIVEQLERDREDGGEFTDIDERSGGLAAYPSRSPFQLGRRRSMKRFAMVVLISLWSAPAIFGASGTWPGKVSDSHCGASHKENGPPSGGQKLSDAECAELCIASGAKYVFVTDNAVYAIANQNFKDVRANIGGKTVQLDGDLEGTTITVSKISPIRKKASTKN